MVLPQAEDCQVLLHHYPGIKFGQKACQPWFDKSNFWRNYCLSATLARQEQHASNNMADCTEYVSQTCYSPAWLHSKLCHAFVVTVVSDLCLSAA